MTIRLRGGFETEDRRLDRLPEFDKRSLAYLAVEGIEQKPLRSYTWSLADRLNQGQEGACVGAAVTHELLARPAKVKGVDMAYAREEIYWRSQRDFDDWPGGAYPGATPFYEGTSVLGGMKAATALGWYGGYTWAWSVEELALAVAYRGPAVLGVNWYGSFFEPDADGLITIAGNVAGGHAILANGVSVKRRQFRLTNSWGPSFGLDGQCFISFDDMARLFDEAGEAAVPVKRKRVIA